MGFHGNQGHFHMAKISKQTYDQKDLLSCITNPITTRNIGRLGLKLVTLWVILYYFLDLCNFLLIFMNMQIRLFA